MKDNAHPAICSALQFNVDSFCTLVHIRYRSIAFYASIHGYLCTGGNGFNDNRVILVMMCVAICEAERRMLSLSMELFAAIYGL